MARFQDSLQERKAWSPSLSRQVSSLTPRDELLLEKYDIDGLLGHGAFSTVWRSTHRANGEVRAIKKIDTSALPPAAIAHELALMRLLAHDNIVRCYEVYLEGQCLNLVLDLFAGGDLIDALNMHRCTRGRIPNDVLVNAVRQMVAAIDHMHRLQIVHRDIKGENFLLDRADISDMGCRVALADFGTAIRLEPGQHLSTQVGTTSFWAPEISEQPARYDCLADIWALGIAVFILLTGALPLDPRSFGSARREERAAARAQRSHPFAVPYYATRLCTDFLTACLEEDPLSRITASEAAQHGWLAKGRSSESEASADFAREGLRLLLECVFEV